MRNTKTKFAEDLTSFALVILGIILVIILMSSCATNKSSYYQDHLRSTHNHNFVKQDNGGCGWNR